MRSGAWSWKLRTYSSDVLVDELPLIQRRQAAAMSRPTAGARACIHRGRSAIASSSTSTVTLSMATTTRPTITPVTAANRKVWWVRRAMARASACRWAGSSGCYTHRPLTLLRRRGSRFRGPVPHPGMRVRPARRGRAHASGAEPATLAAMKKLLLLVVIAALATIATKKVRAS